MTEEDPNPKRDSIDLHHPPEVEAEPPRGWAPGGLWSWGQASWLEMLPFVLADT